MLLAGTVGPHSPLKAIFPMVAGQRPLPRHLVHGRAARLRVRRAYLGLTGGAQHRQPAAPTRPSDPQLLADLAGVEADHANGLATYHAAFTAKILHRRRRGLRRARTGRRATPPDVLQPDRRQPHPGLPGRRRVRHLPARRAAQLRRAAERLGRPPRHRADAARTSATTGRYQLIDGPWEHLNGSSVDVDPLELEWFDTWLKHEHTGMAQTPTPLHYYDLGTGKFRETTTYPFTGRDADAALPRRATAR